MGLIKNKGKDISPSVNGDDLSKESKFDYLVDENGEKVKVIYVNEGNIINPNRMKEVFTEFINTEFNRYVEKAWSLTCDNIDTLIDEHKNGLNAHVKNKIEVTTQNIFQDFSINKIEKMIEERVETKLDEIFEKVSTNIANRSFQDILKRKFDQKLNELGLKIKKK